MYHHNKAHLLVLVKQVSLNLFLLNIFFLFQIYILILAAVLFSKYGCKVVLTGRSEQKLNETVQQLHNSSSENVRNFY